MNGKAAMGELLREHSTLAEQIAETMAERDAQRDQLTREMTNGATSDDANALLKRIRAFSQSTEPIHDVPDPLGVD